MGIRSPRLARVAASLLMLALLLTGCGDDASEPSDPPRIQKADTDSGDEQEGLVSFSLGAPLRVTVTRNSRPAADVPVAWSTEDGGEMSPPISVTDEAGIAQTQWTLGPGAGDQTASASVEDGDGSPVTFTATAVAPSEPTTTTIQVSDNEFSPQNVTVRVNRTVTWVWAEGGTAHNVVPSNGVAPPSSGPPVPGPKSFVHAFDTPGVYPYYCEVHGSADGTGMFGTITVLDDNN